MRQVIITEKWIVGRAKKVCESKAAHKSKTVTPILSGGMGQNLCKYCNMVASTMFSHYSDFYQLAIIVVILTYSKQKQEMCVLMSVRKK